MMRQGYERWGGIHENSYGVAAQYNQRDCRDSITPSKESNKDSELVQG